MQTFAAIMSMMLLFSSTGLALPAPNDDLAVPNDAPLERRDNVRCYHSGYATSRAKLTEAIDDFCDQVGVSGLRKNNAVEKSFSIGESAKAIISVKPKQCSAIDKDLQCKITLRQPVDECNTDSANFKQGGYVDTGCATWRIDPNL